MIARPNPPNQTAHTCQHKHKIIVLQCEVRKKPRTLIKKNMRRSKPAQIVFSICTLHTKLFLGKAQKMETKNAQKLDQY